MSDDSLKKAFIETTQKLDETTRQISALKSKLQFKSRDKRIGELASSELKKYPTSTNCYKTVGKMFVKQEMSVILTSIDQMVTDSEKDSHALTRAVEKMENDARDLERGLKELLQRRAMV